MRTLVIDSATEACSVALFDRGALVAGTYEVIGRGHAERLVPMIVELPDKGHADRVVVCMTGGHGEWFVQDFGADGRPESEHASLAPAEAAAGGHALVAGTQAPVLVAARGSGEALDLLPDAREFLLLSYDRLTATLSPLYGRPPDARLPAA